MASKVQLDLDYTKLTIGKHEDVSLPQVYETASEHLVKLQDMDIREDDVLLCSYPKSGTHWMFRVIDMLQRGQAVYDKRTVESTYIDAQRIDRMAELDSPRCLISHLSLARVPKQIRDKRTKIVHMYRNPRGVLVSFHSQPVDYMRKQQLPEPTIQTSVDNFFSGETLYTGWFNYMDAMNAYQKEQPDHPILNISYDDMTLEPLETVKKLAEFLGKTVTPEFCEEVVEACRFKKQKEAEESDKLQASFKMYRKGDMNDWKNHLTVAVDERFQCVLKERAVRCPFSATFCRD